MSRTQIFEKKTKNAVLSTFGLKNYFQFLQKTTLVKIKNYNQNRNPDEFIIIK